MLQQIRDRSQSMAAKVIVGAVIVTLALFGIESLVGLFSQSNDSVAEVNGEPVSRQAVEMQVQRAIRSGQVPPDQERQLRNQVIDQLITQQLLDQYAERGGLYMSDAQIDRIIVNRPEFQDQDGHFSADAFRNRLSSAGYTPQSFRHQLQSDLLRQQVQQGLAVSEFMLPNERDQLSVLRNQSRSFRYYTLNRDDLSEPVSVDEQAVQAYYDQHRDQFQRPEQVKLNYVILDQASLAADVEVSEQALRSAYAERKAEAPRRISHIMVSFGDERTREEARQRLQQVREQLQAGEDFAQLANEYSDDTTTSGKGGALGVINRGFFGEEFENAAFSLEQGQVSDIVETDNGLHLLKATGVELPLFAEMRDELREQVAMQQAQDRFNELAQRLIDESFAAEDLASVAEDLGLKVQSSDWVSRNDVSGVLAEPGVMDAAFQPDVLEEGYNSDVIELDDQRRMVLRVTDHREATALPLEDVREQARAKVEAEAVQQALSERAAELAEALKAGRQPAIDWKVVESVTRRSVDDSVPDAVVAQAFRLPRPPASQDATYGKADTQQGVALIALDSVSAGEVSKDDPTDIDAMMAERLRIQAAIQGLLQSLREEAEIERH
ncbi:SurA N-terminal domain-containing protein [Halomonas sp. HP20-15]|uniref:SurA N-terminal domain-containing protein n=1 Tax=Halomonas sp. HP20-15 TaxID=3085901 RepID=UPI0029810E76|nr:SurA N-terminal domain-containing protein [Halomonas sp. HP20-15]MDW5375292.1 SurA N-terminal domain-containing protein [Halomonas sp. HP20-15]